MWLIKNQSKDVSYVKLLWMRIGEHPEFELTKGDDVETGSGIEWIITDIKSSTWTLKTWEEIDTFVMTLIDSDGETLKWSSSLNNVTRWVLNSIISMTDEQLAKPIQIQVWESEKNEKTYKNGTVRQDGEMIPWKLSFQEQSEMIEVTKNAKGKVVEVDREKLHNYLLEEAEKLSDRAKKVNKEQEIKKQKEEPKQETPDDLPF